MKEYGIDLILHNQMIRVSEIGLSQPSRLLCINVAVDKVIIIKCQSHNYLSLVLPNTVTGILGKTYMQMPRCLKTSCISAVENIKTLADNMSFIKEDVTIRA